MRYYVGDRFRVTERNNALNNLGTTLLKIVALAGGAFTGALLARWIDDTLSHRAQERSHYDKNRYEQGLPPISTEPLADE
jgi:hypothetical protein